MPPILLSVSHPLLALFSPSLPLQPCQTVGRFNSTQSFSSSASLVRSHCDGIDAGNRHKSWSLSDNRWRDFTIIGLIERTSRWSRRYRTNETRPEKAPAPVFGRFSQSADIGRLLAKCRDLAKWRVFVLPRMRYTREHRCGLRPPIKPPLSLRVITLKHSNAPA